MKLLCGLMLLIGAASALPEGINLPEGVSEKAFVNLGGREYFFDTSNPSTWTQARSFCRTLGLFILSIETEEENVLIKDYITNVAGVKDYWTGGNDFGRPSGDYIWDATAAQIIYTDWAPGEPNHDRDEHYIHIRPINGELKWNDDTENSQFYVICEEL